MGAMCASTTSAEIGESGARLPAVEHPRRVVDLTWRTRCTNVHVERGEVVAHVMASSVANRQRPGPIGRSAVWELDQARRPVGPTHYERGLVSWLTPGAAGALITLDFGGARCGQQLTPALVRALTSREDQLMPALKKHLPEIQERTAATFENDADPTRWFPGTRRNEDHSKGVPYVFPSCSQGPGSPPCVAQSGANSWSCW